MRFDGHVLVQLVPRSNQYNWWSFGGGEGRSPDFSLAWDGPKYRWGWECPFGRILRYKMLIVGLYIISRNYIGPGWGRGSLLMVGFAFPFCIHSY